ncbi:leucyl/phenylalanyl-tRNA--protein transferase [Devosia limi DSM 17137]|uniref:Leucyl/phenylalanyl-tRNA--protein transferase n=1 Tax=Devosia limi DSM 17137 TaxID=1121477 RepID=A0A0F5LMZ6_9HYPH|nr:leucyl/phenylalanyl-tRNA--protein transferase [Devosia limi]KKB83693.1 leucyl/phenylalanyl-tRNA--protein transferase [Devosia limi DSM 17137]SHE74093.1 leucyl/phenylalanyl-tRNA--protein transferase [Devosia limi DSM 17137]
MSRPNPFDVEITPELIIRAYRAGIFPMAEDASSTDLFWVSPEMRGIIPLDGFKLSTSLRKAIRQSDFTIRVDTDFAGVIEGCASVGSDRDSTWINASIRAVYGELFRRGVCHTVEVWDRGALVGGLYGLAIDGAFFGESMFHRRTNASKMAMAHLVERLKAGGYVLLDTQFLTDHLASLGGIEIPREDYEERLADALEYDGDWTAWDRG